MKKIIASLLLAVILSAPLTTFARPSAQVYDWYIKDRQVEVIVNRDASLDITENILADCGNLPDKHGIFYSIPTFYQLTANQKVSTPIELKGITHNGVPEKYTSSTNAGILTWKIGDPDITVRGENQYTIKYKVKRAIRFGNPSFDEFYWNITGDFSTLENDHLMARVIFPSEITDKNSETNIYSGEFRSVNSLIARYTWVDNNVLQIESLNTLMAGEGVTASVTFPKNIISPPVLTFWEKYGTTITLLVLLLIPLLTLVVCFRLWLKHGRDFKLGRAIAPEFEIPEKMTPMEMGTFLDNGSLKSSHISASIVNLAVKGFMKIEDIPKKGIFSSADTRFIKISKDDSSLTKAEKDLMSYLFGGSQEVLLSSLKNKFYSKIPLLKETNFKKLKEKNLFETEGFGIQSKMFLAGFILLISLFFLPSLIQIVFIYPILIFCTATIFIFAALMPRRSLEGTDLLGRVRGFKMYMMTAEKYRQKFNEKENIFETFLPYAMLFGITGIWINKMKQIYGEEYFNSYYPAWYAGSIAGFNIDSFTTQLNSLTSSMSSTISSSPSSSGSGGGGFSGGGGGGGSVGGW